MTDRDMRILTASPRWTNAFGLTLDQSVGRTLYEIAPDYFERFRENHQLCLAGKRFSNPRLRSELNGKVEWLETEVIPWRDHNGEIGGILISAPA